MQPILPGGQKQVVEGVTYRPGSRNLERNLINMYQNRDLVLCYYRVGGIMCEEANPPDSIASGEIYRKQEIGM